MPAFKCTCPECNLTFQPPQPVPATITCPICDHQFSPARGKGQTLAPETRRRSGTSSPPVRERVVSVPAAPPSPMPAASSLPPRPGPPSGRRKVFFRLLAASLVVYLGIGAVLVAYLVHGGPKQESVPVEPPRDAAQAVQPPGSPPDQSAASPPSVAEPPKPVPTARQIEINQAIDRGVNFCRRQLVGLTENRAQLRFRQEYYEGLISLLGLTLLECGVPAGDPVLQETAKTLREQAGDIQKTYSLSLAILFLDRLGESRDRDLIQTFALRLIAGQTRAGTWSYDCHPLDSQEEQQLLTFLKTVSGDSPEKPGFKGAPADLPLSTKLKNLTVVRESQGSGPPGRVFEGDHSNTQFGLLALWVARRHGIPVQPVLALVDRYFRSVQLGDGSWGYTSFSNQWRASMTCAGLLGLAVGRGLGMKAEKPDAPDQAGDPAIANGFRFLGGTIDPGGQPKRRSRRKGIGRMIGADAHGDLYYLWSLERVAMVYDLKTIGGKDWYDWASEAILDAQHEDGSWQDTFPGPVDTCFALLVLRQANVVKDLTSDIKRLISIKELEGLGAGQGDQNPKPPGQ